MKITILGNCGPYPRAYGACSGYLFECGDIKILIDCGNGTMSRLQQKVTNLGELDMIILSHFHSDHISDVMVLRYAIGYKRMNNEIENPIPLYAPSTPKEDFHKLQFKNAFALKSIEENLKVNYKNLTISFKKMNHSIDCYGVMIKNNNEKFVYSADTKYCNQILELSQDADLLLCESTVLEKDKTPTTSHLSAKDAGQIAKKSNVGKLLLTHFWPEYNLEEIHSEASEVFDGNVQLSEEMKTYFI
ncbi:MBL fold metallo-hydrolase [Crassaminicella thermophila]|uniref:MBL fold metallo-hydrolase n=1 Tax=Crassaminicella thermophila TaxID=2599308 RepID=A0A5C0SE40_CRATE|nr:MBL fold metallo-hydrolase [Crassaminicella thermophila]QEK11229.1 MBL fold metallo-hydrolase [Crassaminicella thermophila]